MAPKKASRLVLRDHDTVEFARRLRASGIPSKTSRKSLRDQDRPKIFIRNRIFLRKLRAVVINNGRPKIVIRNQEFLRRLRAPPASSPLRTVDAVGQSVAGDMEQGDLPLVAAGDSIVKQVTSNNVGINTNAEPSWDNSLLGACAQMDDWPSFSEPMQIHTNTDMSSSDIFPPSDDSHILTTEQAWARMNLQYIAKQAPAAMEEASTNPILAMEKEIAHLNLKYARMNLQYIVKEALAAMDEASTTPMLHIEKVFESMNLQCNATQAPAAMDEAATNLMPAIEGPFARMNLQCNETQAPAAMDEASTSPMLTIEGPFARMNLQGIATQAPAATNVPATKPILAIEGEFAHDSLVLCEASPWVP